MKIGFDAKRYYHNRTGLGNYSRTLVDDMRRLFPENEYVLYDERSLKRTFMLGRTASRDGCDIYHGLSNELPVYLAKRRGLKTVVTMHDICWKTYPDMYHTFDRHMYDRKYGRSCRKADRVVAISESTKRDVMHYYGVPEERIDVIYQPVQKFFYTPMTAIEADALIHESLPLLPKDYVLYVGSINARKNLMAVVKALALIPKDQRPMLLVVGNGREYRRKVEQYVYSHGLRDSVMIESNIYNNRLLQALYRQARVFLYPSFYEGFGLPVVEAALQHTPVITTTVSSLPEAAGPDACLIDPNSSDAVEILLDYMKRLLTDDAYNESVATRMEQYARRMFAPDTLTRQMVELYGRVKNSE